MSLHVLLVEDEPLLRSALASALAGEDMQVVAALPDARQAIDTAPEDLDVLVTDLDLGSGPNGIVLAHALRRRYPRLGVVLLTSYAEPRLVSPKLAQLPPGAEYVMKQSVNDLDYLRVVVRRAYERAAHRMPTLTGREHPGTALTDTQIETMRLVAAGLTNAEIARRRFVTEKSVEVMISRLLRQLRIEPGGVKNPRVQITQAYYALAGTLGPRPSEPA